MSQKKEQDPQPFEETRCCDECKAAFDFDDDTITINEMDNIYMKELSKLKDDLETLQLYGWACATNISRNYIMLGAVGAICMYLSTVCGIGVGYLLGKK
jgi:hypothetical protein